MLNKRKQQTKMTKIVIKLELYITSYNIIENDNKIIADYEEKEKNKIQKENHKNIVCFMGKTVLLTINVSRTMK